MKAIRIDVTNKTVEMVDIGTELQDLYDALKCEVVTAVFPQDPTLRVELYVDEESLIKDFHDIPGAFAPNFYTVQPLFGHGLIVSHDSETGELCDVKMTVEEAVEQIRFLSDDETRYFFEYYTTIPPMVISF